MTFRRAMHHRNRNRSAQASALQGFTLIEILVVMIILGMIGSILFQALERTYRLQDRFGIELFSLQQRQMVTDWYRQTVQGLRPDYPDGKSIFKGDSRGFTGLTDSSLGESSGVPTSITWQLRKNRGADATELVYLEGQKETSALDWGGSDARFIYLDGQLLPHDSWPPPMGPWPQLPHQIQLVTQDRGESVIIIATPVITAQPVIRLKDL